MKHCLCIVLALSLAACAAKSPPEAQIIVKKVTVPTPVSCLPDNFDRTPPDYPDTRAAIDAGDVQLRSQLVTAANILLHQRNDILEEVAKACAK